MMSKVSERVANGSKLRVLFVPDSVHWVTGTIAKNLARFNPWIEATIASGQVIDQVFAKQPELMRNFDLVHFTCPYASKEWLPRFRDFVPCVTSHHHVSDWELLSHNLGGDAIVVGSPEWDEDLRARGAEMCKVFCVPYGVDAEFFRPASGEARLAVRRKLGIPANALAVGFFGKNSSNDYDRKGIDVFAKAILSLRELPQLAVLIVGPGWKELVDHLRSSGARCTWIPFVRDQKGLAETYNALDFYWVTARVEGGPVTLLEAMSTEVCCLTTPVGLAREIVRNGENAMMLPFNDANAFVERTTLLADAEMERKRLGHNARATILKQMHVSVTARQIEHVYTKAFENFARRQSLAEGRVNVSEIARALNTNTNVPQGQDSVPLNAFPAALHRRVRMLEALAWSEHLILYQRQRSVAIRLILQEWVRNPLSLLPPRVLLRRLLPVSVVAAVVRVKKKVNRPVTTHAG